MYWAFRRTRTSHKTVFTLIIPKFIIEQPVRVQPDSGQSLINRKCTKYFHISRLWNSIGRFQWQIWKIHSQYQTKKRPIARERYITIAFFEIFLYWFCSRMLVSCVNLSKARPTRVINGLKLSSFVILLLWCRNWIVSPQNCQ